jgi:membrane-bound lytic murein transglycosylase F
MKFGLAFMLLVVCATTAQAQRGVPDTYDDIFRKYSKQYFGVAFDWKVFKAQSMAESNLNPEAQSWVGAKGLMQLMPATYKEIQSKNPDIGEINDPRWNIAAGIYYDRQLWKSWTNPASIADRISFVLSSYNAGRRTILNAQDTAAEAGLDERTWPNVETVAPQVPRWRHEETLDYVRRIESFYQSISRRSGFELLMASPEPAPRTARKEK